MAILKVEKASDGVVVVRWEDGENRFNLGSVAEWHGVLDELEATDGPLALVVTGTGKFFSNGLDLDRFKGDSDEGPRILDGVHRLFGRLLLLPVWTTFAINGHCFAAGAMMSCTADQRFMRTERGFWCLPEVDLGLPLTPEMTAAVTARLPTDAAAHAMLTGMRYSGEAALDRGLVDRVFPEAELLDAAIAEAQTALGRDRTVIGNHKRQLFADAARACGVDS